MKVEKITKITLEKEQKETLKKAVGILGDIYAEMVNGKPKIGGLISSNNSDVTLSTIWNMMFTLDAFASEEFWTNKP